MRSEAGLVTTTQVEGGQRQVDLADPGDQPGRDLGRGVIHGQQVASHGSVGEVEAVPQGVFASEKVDIPVVEVAGVVLEDGHKDDEPSQQVETRDACVL